MFALAQGVWEWLFHTPEYYALFLGIESAGKTTLLERLKNRYSPQGGLEISKIIPTIGMNYGRLILKKNALVIWDVGGHPALRSIWDDYFVDADVIVFVVDAANVDALPEVRKALQIVLSQLTPEASGLETPHTRSSNYDKTRQFSATTDTRKSTVAKTASRASLEYDSSEALSLMQMATCKKHVPLVILANKQDLPSALTPEQLMQNFVSDQQLQRWMETSSIAKPVILGCSALLEHGTSEAIVNILKTAKNAKDHDKNAERKEKLAKEARDGRILVAQPAVKLPIAISKTLHVSVQTGASESAESTTGSSR